MRSVRASAFRTLLSVVSVVASSAGTAFAAVAVLSFASVASLAAEPMSQNDRQRLVAHLEMTESWLVDELKNLSKAQLTFKMTPESWNIMEVVEHLAIAEPQYWKQVQDSMKQPAATDKPSTADKSTATDKPTATDAAILWYGIDRTRRDRTGEARVPHQQFATIQDSLAAFRKLRVTMLDYAKRTTEDPRSRKLEGGNMDVYQWCLMISTHSQRHILQIREIKAHAGYPIP